MAAVVKRTNNDNIKGISQRTSPNRIQGNFKGSPGEKGIKNIKIGEVSKDTEEVIKDLTKLFAGKRRSSKKTRKSRRRKSSRSRKRRSRKRR